MTNRIAALVLLCGIVTSTRYAPASATGDLQLTLSQSAGAHVGSAWVKLVLLNGTGEDLHVAFTPLSYRLKFKVVDMSHHERPERLYPNSGRSVQGRTYFPAGEVQQFRIRLDDFVNIEEPGTYMVQARLQVGVRNEGAERWLVSNKIVVNIAR
jgi:hypothetical protein